MRVVGAAATYGGAAATFGAAEAARSHGERPDVILGLLELAGVEPHVSATLLEVAADEGVSLRTALLDGCPEDLLQTGVAPVLLAALHGAV